MTRLLLILLILSLCTSCTALPAEERSFAVALCIEKKDGLWCTHGRIPTYQSGGGYLTIAGEGPTLSASLADIESSAPMHLHLSQLRLLVLDEALAASGELAAVLHELADRTDLRRQCAVALTDVPAGELAETLTPTTGARLSKTLDVLLETRIEQGTILPATLADVIRMGERQSPVLLALTVEDKEMRISGGYALDAALRSAVKLSPEEMMLLAMLRGSADHLRLNLTDGGAQVRDVSSRIGLTEEGIASVTLCLRATSSNLTPDGMESLLARECLALLSRLSAAGCDALGLGRKAIRNAHTMSKWHGMDWPQRLGTLRWSISVQVEGPA